MILHIPHDPEDNDVIPEELDNFDVELIPFNDIGAYEFFSYAFPSANILRFPLNRLICDVERLEHGEPLDAKGMGICYERDQTGRRIRTVSREYRDDIIERFYKPHHMMLQSMVEAEIEATGHATIIDGHTFRRDPWEYEDTDIRPEVCIGFDKRDACKGSRIVECLNESGITAMANVPFQGAIKPLRYLDDPRVSSIMIEIRQDVVGSDEIRGFFRNNTNMFL